MMRNQTSEKPSSHHWLIYWFYHGHWTLESERHFKCRKAFAKKHCDSIMKYILQESKIWSTAIKWWTKRSRHGCFFLSQSVCMEVNLEFNKLWLDFLTWSRLLLIFLKYQMGNRGDNFIWYLLGGKEIHATSKQMHLSAIWKIVLQYVRLR